MQFCGIDGGELSLFTQLVAFCVCFLKGFLGSPKGLLGFCIGMGLIANVLGQIVFAGGGPGACAGMCGLPLLCLASGYLGEGLHTITRPRKPPIAECGSCGFVIREDETRRCPQCGQLARCTSCGYNLTGNVSGVCPECGKKIE